MSHSQYGWSLSKRAWASVCLLRPMTNFSCGSSQLTQKLYIAKGTLYLNLFQLMSHANDLNITHKMLSVPHEMRPPLFHKYLRYNCSAFHTSVDFVKHIVCTVHVLCILKSIKTIDFTINFVKLYCSIRMYLMNAQHIAQFYV